MNWEYLIIAIFFLIALFYIWQKVVIPFNKNKGGSCGKGCGCGVDHKAFEQDKK